MAKHKLFLLNEGTLFWLLGTFFKEHFFFLFNAPITLEKMLGIILSGEVNLVDDVDLCFLC